MHDQAAPGEWFVRHAALLAAGASLLDVGAGRGRHARFFAARGVLVTAADRDADALSGVAAVPGVVTEVRDLEQGDWPYAPAAFDGVLVSNYLWRPTLDALLGSLRPGGVLLYETFMDGNERFGKPSRPDFLLRSNELLERTRDAFRVLAFAEGEEYDDSGSPVAMKQKIAAIRR